MEELLAYAYLMEESSDLETMYEEKLNELFLLNPDNEDLLELEFLSSNKKATILYIRAHIDYSALDCDKFGKTFMNLLRLIYQKTDIDRFGRWTYSVWKNLPDVLAHDAPFYTLSFASDPLSWGDEKQTRKLYEDMFMYYD